MIAYKLFRIRKDGSLGSLFINRPARLPIGKWIEATAHRTEGFAFRPGWHACPKPYAPHLSNRGRQWYKVELRKYNKFNKPEAQGGMWFTAKYMRILEKV